MLPRDIAVLEAQCRVLAGALDRYHARVRPHHLMLAVPAELGPPER
ncbi:hypothetical protein [Devosia sp. A16]|nr:hypothetical protein [Devosia sp. A16]